MEEPLDRMDSIFLRPRITSKVALTQGDWEVMGKKIWVDEVNSIVYFCGLREGPLEQHVYAVSLRRPLEIRLLTRPGYSYNSIYFNKECTMLVTVYSSIKTLPTCQVRLSSNKLSLIYTIVGNYSLYCCRYLKYRKPTGRWKVYRSHL